MELLELNLLRGDLEPCEALLGYGWRYGSTNRSEDYLHSIPQNIRTLDGKACKGLPGNLTEAARNLLNVYGDIPSNSETLFRYSETVFLGPTQAALVQLLRENNCKPNVQSGYRSPLFQALVFCARFLDGTLLDADGRYSCLPPGFSDHNIVDGAIDIVNSEQISVMLSTLIKHLPCSIYRPYLFSSIVCTEPWHWRTVNCTSSVNITNDEQNDSKPIDRRYLHELIQFFDESYHVETGLVPTKSEEFIFVKGFDREKSICIGSKRQTFTLSLADANNSVGRFPSKIVSVPLGFTPLMDGKIAHQDVGTNIFELVGSTTASPTYITPSSCIHERVNTPRRIIQSLEEKAGLKIGERYSLSQSLADEWLIHHDSVIVPMEHGIPRAGYYRINECARLLASRFDEWLCRNSQNGLPPYMTAVDGTILDQHFDVARYALLACYIAETSKNKSLDKLQSFMAKNFERIENRLRDDKTDVNYNILSEIIFIVKFFLNYKLSLAEEMLDYWLSSIMSPVSWKFDENVPRIIIGHFASLLLQLHPKHVEALSSIIPSARTALSWVDQSLLYSLAAAQVLRYRHILGDPEALECANRLVCKIVRQASSPASGEFGAFNGLETFQSALPIEAVAEIWTLIDLSMQDQALVARRLRLAMGFLARCQLDEGVVALSKTRGIQVGAVSYSLVDRHCRVDYGVHASRAARFLTSIEGKFDAAC